MFDPSPKTVTLGNRFEALGNGFRSLETFDDGLTSDPRQGMSDALGWSKDAIWTSRGCLLIDVS